MPQSSRDAASSMTSTVLNVEKSAITTIAPAAVGPRLSSTTLASGASDSPRRSQLTSETAATADEHVEHRRDENGEHQGPRNGPGRIACLLRQLHDFRETNIGEEDEGGRRRDTAEAMRCVEQVDAAQLRRSQADDGEQADDLDHRAEASETTPTPGCRYTRMPVLAAIAATAASTGGVSSQTLA